MNKIKYLIQFIIIITLFLIFRILGLKYSQILSKKIFKLIGPYFRKDKITDDNLKIVYSDNKNFKVIKELVTVVLCQPV